MKTRNLLFVVVAGMALTACSFDSRELEYDSEAPVKLRITANMGKMSVTRGLTDTQNEKMDNNATPAAYVVLTGTTTANYASSGAGTYYDYSNVPMTSTGAASGNSSTLAINATSSTIPAFYFPQNKGALDVYLYAPREGTSPSLTAMPITVAADQTSQADYLASDFVFGNAISVAQASATANITLFHALTKIKLV